MTPFAVAQDAESFCLVTLDIGGTKIAGAVLELTLPECSCTTPVSAGTSAALAKAKWEIKAETSIWTRASEGGAEVAKTTAQFAQELVSAATALGLSPHGIAISSAGVVDPVGRRIISATSIMPGWGGIALGEIVSQATALPVEILNDVHAHALGEVLWGAGTSNALSEVAASSALVFAVGTGLGGAVVINGEVVFGTRGIAGHLGHIPHQMAQNFRCSCGRTGHIEAISSGSGLTNFYNHRRESHHLEDGFLSDRLSLPATNGFEVYQRAQSGDVVAQAALLDSAQALGEVMGALANALDPALIIVSGSMARSGHEWWESLARGYRLQAMNPLQELPLVPGILGGKAPLLGAAAWTILQKTTVARRQ